MIVLETTILRIHLTTYAPGVVVILNCSSCLGNCNHIDFV
jgi:hypothetical protein